MSIRSRIIVIYLSIVLHDCIIKTPDFTFIGCHNVRIESYRIVATASVCSPSWHEDVHVCDHIVFIPYPLRKFRLTSSFSYLWLWHIYVLTYHLLSADYVCIQLVHFCLFFLCLHAKSFPFSSCIHAWFDSSSFCLHAGSDFFFVWYNLNHISNTLFGWGWSHLQEIYVLPPHDYVNKFR